MKTQRILAVTLGLVFAAFLAGCGGGSGINSAASSGRKGAIQFTVKWPAKVSRLIPIMSQSVVVTVTNNAGAVVGTKPITKPVGVIDTTSATIDNLSPGVVHVTATAYPDPTGTGTAQATGHEDVTVVAGQTTTAPTLRMNSTITQVTLLVSGGPYKVGDTILVSPSAKDADGNVVLVPDSAYLQEPSDPTAFTLVDQSRIKALKAGQFTYKVMEHESGVESSPFNITVSAAPAPKFSVIDRPNHRLVTLSDTIDGANFNSIDLGVTVQDMATDTSGNMYLAEGGGELSSSPYVVELSPTGTEIGRFRPTVLVNGNTIYPVPYNIAVDPQGRIYVHIQVPDPAQGVTNWIYRYDNISGDPAKLKTVQMPVQLALGLASDGNFLYLYNGFGGDNIYRIAADLSGSWSSPYGQTGGGRDQFQANPLYGSLQSPGTHVLALDPTGTYLYIADTNNERFVQVTTAGFNNLPDTSGFNFASVPLAATTQNGSRFMKPLSVAIDGANQHVAFGAFEDIDDAGDDYYQNANVVNALVGKFDITGFATHQAKNRTVIGGTKSLTAADGAFGLPTAVGAK